MLLLLSSNQVFTHKDLLQTAENRALPNLYRLTLGIGKLIPTEDDLHFILDAQDCLLNADGSQKYTTLWSEIGAKTAVPIGKWFTLEYYFKEGNAKNGRFYMTIEPDGGKKEMIFDVTNVTHNSPDAAPDGVTHFNPMKMYTFKKLIAYLKIRGNHSTSIGMISNYGRSKIISMQKRNMRILFFSVLLLNFMASFAQPSTLVADSANHSGNYFTRRVEKNKKIVADSIMIEGHWRNFHFRKPNVKSKGFSLVFVMHGSGGSGPAMMKRAPEFDDIADQEKMIAVFPSGYKNFWNECRKKSTAEANAIDINEQAFFQGMINYFVKKYGIDKKKVFAVGTSGGGHMAFKLGLTMPAAFKAITAIVANLPDTNNLDCAASGLPMNVMIVNGTEDKTNPYNGGEVILGSGNFGFVRSSERSLQYWADLAGYTGAPAKKLLPDLDPKDGKRIESYSHSGGKKEVVLLKVIGGKHDYPGDINLHRYSWEFFKSVQ